MLKAQQISVVSSSLTFFAVPGKKEFARSEFRVRPTQESDGVRFLSPKVKDNRAALTDCFPAFIIIDDLVASAVLTPGRRIHFPRVIIVGQ